MADTKVGELKKDTDLVSVQPEILAYVDNTHLESLDYDQLVELGRGVSEVKVYSQWLLGKIGNTVSQKYGDMYRFAKDIGLIGEVLQQYVNTYRKYTSEDPNFSPDKYHGVVPWGMLQFVATKGDKPVTLLNELVDKGVRTFDQTYREMKERETGVKVPQKPKVVFKWNYEIKKWKIALRPEDLDLIDWTDVKEQLLVYLEGLK